MRHLEIPAGPDPHRALALAALVSVALHAALIFLFWLGSLVTAGPDRALPLEVELISPEPAGEVAQAPPAPPPSQAVPEAEAPAPPRPKTQIVAPPDGPSALPKDPKYLSEKDSRAEEEMIKRGEPAPPAPPPGERARAGEELSPGESKKTLAPERSKQPTDLAGRTGRTEDRPTSPQASDLPGLASLFAKPSELIDDPRLGRGQDEREAARDEGARDLASLGRPNLWADPGERGTPDYLPDVRQGSFTLLNTKADLFAPFVRRVGLRVFQTFSMDFKRQIFAGQVPAGQEKIEVEAVMSRDGRRLDITLKRRDGNLATDRVLLSSLSDQVFFDENPPPKAVAEDGRIHFVFAVDSAVWYGRNDNGTIRPGAQWIFGAGLL